MSFFVCVCVHLSRVCACAWWKTPSQCCLNGHAVLWQPCIPSCCVAEVNTIGVLRRPVKDNSSSYIQQPSLAACRSVSDLTLCSQSLWSIVLTQTRPNSAVWWISCHGFGVVSTGSWTSPSFFFFFLKEVGSCAQKIRSQTTVFIVCEWTHSSIVALFYF